MVDTIYVDAHAHLDRYGMEITQVLTDLQQKKIVTLAVSMDPESYIKTLHLSNSNSWIIPAFGIHPWEAYKHVRNLDMIRWHMSKSPFFGEIGLDFYFVKDRTHYPVQVEMFKLFLAEATQQGKLVNIHTKGAERETCDLLRAFKTEQVIVHWYSGAQTHLKKLIKFGCYFSILKSPLFNNKDLWVRGLEMLHRYPVVFW
ncbi:TatD family hydrolase [bacterium]|nr:TatD family hydrolase [candidate division CSSED10-310 bacterium]